jgi:hypothetical protein
MSKICGNCAIADHKRLVCRLHGREITNTYTCSDWTKNLENCAICGAPVVKPLIYNNNYICRNCASKFGTCERCQNANICPFETHPSPTPKVVHSTRIRNPDRVEETCAALCNCFSPTFGCLKENNTCGLYREKELV